MTTPAPGDVDYDNLFWPSYRFTLAAKWWTVAELARRNPSLRVAAVSSDSDVDVTLDLRDESAVDNLSLLSSGSIHLFPGGDGFELLEPAAVFHASRPHDVISEIEKIMAWDGSSNSVAPRPLTYRLLAGIANARVFDPYEWDIVAIDELHPDHFRRHFGAFNGLQDVYDAGLAQVRTSGTWAITRDSEPLAVITETATLYRRKTDPIELMTVFDHVDRSVPRLLAAVLSLADNE